MRVVGSPLRAVQVGTFASVIGAVGVAWITPHPALTALFVLLFGFSIGVYFNGLIAIIIDGAGDRQDTAIFVVGAIGPMGGMFGAALGGLAVGAAADYAGWKVLVAVLATVLLAAMFGTRRAVLTRTPQPDLSRRQPNPAAAPALRSRVKAPPEHLLAATSCARRTPSSAHPTDLLPCLRLESLAFRSSTASKGSKTQR